MQGENILNDFDWSLEAVINPKDIIEEMADFPAVVVATFNKKMLDVLIKAEKLERFTTTASINGENPLYIYQVNNQRIGVTLALLGAPACIGHLEELLAKGAKKIIIFGSCGVLEQDIDHSTIIIPTAAVRDEGTSYHYQPQSLEITPTENSAERLTSFFSAQHVRYETGKTWTTDGFYRETAGKVAKRKEMGCRYVEMECSAIFAWARFRKTEAFVFFYAADSLAEDEWTTREVEIPEIVPDFLKLALILAAEIAMEESADL